VVEVVALEAPKPTREQDMSDKYAVNTKVEWEWGSGTG
jgi:hypothetical protein